MLTRRARANNSYCSQVVLVCLNHFGAIHCWNVRRSRKSPKNTKPLFWGFKVI